MSDFFSGTFYRTLDGKGRLSLPPVWLKALAASCANQEPAFWLTSLYGRLTAYLPKDWENTVSQLCSIKVPNFKIANFKSRLIGLANEMRPDNQGRVLLSQPLCRAAGLGKNVVLVGLMNNFEIWDQGRFESLASDETEIGEELAALGIDIAL